MPRLPFATRLLADRRRVVDGPRCRLAADAIRREDEGPSRRGPGWFESSWDLRAGLEVREGWPDDVRVDEWVDGCSGSKLQSPAALGDA